MTPPSPPHRRYARVAAAFIVAICASLFGVAAGWVAAAPHPADPGPGDPERIEFAPGTDGATVSDSLAPGANASYIFRASAGQTVYVEVGPGEFLARTFIWGEGELAHGGNSVSATLPETGDYVLGVDNTGTTTNFTVTVRVLAETAPPTAGECGVDPQAPVITDSLAAVPPAQQVPGVPWTYLGESNYDPCADLSYAIVDIEGGTGSSPQHVMLFHRGEYIGTSTECAFGFTSVAAATIDSVTVEYRWPREGDANAAPSGSASATFSWNGTEVVMTGELPDELLAISDCDVGTPGSGDTPPVPDATLPATH